MIGKLADSGSGMWRVAAQRLDRHEVRQQAAGLIWRDSMLP